MNMSFILLVTTFSLIVTVISSSANPSYNYNEKILHKITKRVSDALPTTVCDDSKEGKGEIHFTLKCFIWVCRNGEWILYRIDGSSLGRNKTLAADSCKQIKEIGCHTINPKSGVYWVWKKQPMQIYCDMNTDGGGWTLVWKHSYLETSPLSTNMYYFSDYYRKCTTYSSGWCNVPDKKRFNPAEQMIVAYHKGTIVYAYKGIFNYNIDHDWTGGIINNFTKIIDDCTRSGSPNVQPAPSANGGDGRLLGLAFDKRSPCDPKVNCDTISGTFENLVDCRWHDCTHPNRYSVQQTVAIYVR